MSRLFLNKEKLNKGEVIFFILYSLISFALFVGIYFLGDMELLKLLLFFYSYGTVLFLYVFGYKSLRKIYFTQIFTLIGFIHIMFFLLIKDNIDLYFKRGHSGNALNYTIIAVLLIQMLRYLSIKVQQKELVCPDRSGIDMFDNRKTNFFDFIFFLFYLLSFVGFIVMTSN